MTYDFDLCDNGHCERKQHCERYQAYKRGGWGYGYVMHGCTEYGLFKGLEYEQM